MGPYLFGWYILIAIMITAFLVVGSTRLGFGVGFLFASREERPYLIQALQPHMDGSSLWVILIVTALFFLFPLVFGVLFAGFYPVIAVILLVLGFRNIAFGLKGMVQSKYITPVLDMLVSLGNMIPLFLIGVMGGYILKGVPLFNEGRFNVNVLGYIDHYTVASGLLTLFSAASLSFCAIAWNSDGKTRVFARKWAFYSALVLCVLIFDIGLWSLVLSPYISSSLTATPVLYTIPALAFIGAIILPVLIWKWRFNAAYLLAALVTILLIATFFLTIYPNLLDIFMQTNMTRPTEIPLPSNIPRQLPTEIANIFESREKLFPVYALLMALTAFLQYRQFKHYRTFTHCPLPYDEEEEELL